MTISSLAYGGWASINAQIEPGTSPIGYQMARDKRGPIGSNMRIGGGVPYDIDGDHIPEGLDRSTTKNGYNGPNNDRDPEILRADHSSRRDGLLDCEEYQGMVINGQWTMSVRRQLFFFTLVAPLLALTLGGIWSDAAQRRNAHAVMRELEQASNTTELDQSRQDPVKFQRLRDALVAGLELSQEPPGLWWDGKPTVTGLRGGILFMPLVRALSLAGRYAPNQEEQQRWWQARWNLVLRMLRDPHTRRAWVEKWDPQNPLSDYSYVQWTRRELHDARSALAAVSLLEPHEWGLLQGIQYIDAPGAMVTRQDQVYARVDALQATGIPVQIRGASAFVSQGQRQARIPIGASGETSPSRGFRTPNGEVYLPVREFHRQGVFTVEIWKGEQLVEVVLEPPSHPFQVH